jgi:hypothetical protein
MSNNQNEERNLEKAQRNQDKPGDASSEPQTTGPAENLREKAAEMNDSDEEKSKEPA